MARWHRPSKECYTWICERVIVDSCVEGDDLSSKLTNFMADSPTEPVPAKPLKGEIAARISLNRRLEAGDELFDRVLGRIERIERKRRIRRFLIFGLIWIALAALGVCAVMFGPEAATRIQSWW